MSEQFANLNEVAREHELKNLIASKPSLLAIYTHYYQFFKTVLSKCPHDGLALEIGSGAGFCKKIIPEIITSDYLAYSGIDQVVDATQMPFEASSLKFIGMINVLHHIADAQKFFKEAERVLISGGKIAIIDQHHGWLSRWILKYLHHEPYDPKASKWDFKTTGPLSGANGALAWIIFQRDFKRFQEQFPNLKLVKYEPHSPLQYWLSGGLKSWNILPKGAFKAIQKLDAILISISKQFGSFVNIELIKK